jgi:hypothetical protein
MSKEQYFIRAKYTVNRDWFYSPSSVLETTLYFLKTNNKIESSEIISVEYENNDFVAHVKFITDSDKLSFREILKGNSTRVENWEIK